MRGSGLALYNPLTDNWGELIMVSGHPASKINEQAGASWDRVSTDYLQNFGITAAARSKLHERGQRNYGAGRHYQPGIR